jgi:predicted dehydrogenase/threonine dehydrogenase-like Zn-dependent dehydrogenase
MRQILQNLSNGKSEIIDAPIPQVQTNGLLIETTTSLISIGTERMLIDFGKSSLISKALKQPEKVSQVIDKIGTDGLFVTLDAVKSKLQQSIPLGYSNVGIVKESNSNIFSAGDRVVSNASHADIVSVPQNLCAKIPDNVSDEDASFTIVASIGLQGIRLAKPTLGESFVVIGVGLIGLLTVQMLIAHGCKVLAVDIDQKKLDLAHSFGAEICNIGNNEDPISKGLKFSRDVGVDGVIITASTKSDKIVSDSAKMCRKRGRIILIGVVDLNLNRSDFYEKELSFQVSCSYGPGRYDPKYEKLGQDYPIGFVRWTEKRNFETVLELLSNGKLDVSSLISHRFEFNDAIKAYDMLSSDHNSLGISLTYNHSSAPRMSTEIFLDKKLNDPVGNLSLGLIGAGNYASRMLIPSFKAEDITLRTIASAGGTNSVVQGKKYGFFKATTDINNLINDSNIDVVAISSRHDTHAKFTIDALASGKHVYVEKPLALTLEELELIKSEYIINNGLLMVGFNRRFAPHIKTMKRLLNEVDTQKCFVMTMNAGHIHPEHWTQNISIGGGRIIGEACHHIDLMRFLAGSPIISFDIRSFGFEDNKEQIKDTVIITLMFENGSMGSIHYLSNGGRKFIKERIEVFSAGRTLQLNNFVELKGFNWPGFKKETLWRQNKGQKNCIKEFIKAINTKNKSPIPAEDIFEVTEVSIKLASMLSK